MESSSPQSRTRKHEDDQQNEKPQLKKTNFRRQICSKHVGKTENLRNWLDLPSDLMVSILTRVGAAEVLVTSQFVCTSWRKICKDPLIWRCIDMIYSKYSAYTPCALAHLMKIAVDRSCGQLVDVNLEGSPQLTRFRLAECSKVSDDGLIATVSRLPLLTEIDLTLGLFSKSAIDVIGRHCPLLKSFKYNRKYLCIDIAEDNRFDDEALAIAANMSGLQHLMLLGNTLSNDGLKAILDGCSLLVSLDLRCCFNIKLDGGLRKRCSEQIKDFRGPSDSTFDYPYQTEEASNWFEIGDIIFQDDMNDYDYDLWTLAGLFACVIELGNLDIVRV